MIGKIIAAIILFIGGIFIGGYTVPAGIDTGCMVDSLTELNYPQVKEKYLGLGFIDYTQERKMISGFQGNTQIPFLPDVKEDICYNRFSKDLSANEEKYRPLLVEIIRGDLKKCQALS